MKIAVRLDDITPDMDWDRFLEFKNLLDKYRIKPLIGIVPDNRDQNLHKCEYRHDFWDFVKNLEREGWSIALHGYNHIYTTHDSGLFPLNDFSEFAGVAYEEQYSMIKKGKEILESHGISTDIFMAPAHTYDKNTLKALKELGLVRMTDGFGNKPYTWCGMTFYPISFLVSHSLKKKKGITTLVVHVNEIQNMDYYEQIFGGHNEFISYRKYLEISPKQQNVFGRCMEYVLAKVKHCLVKMKSKKEK